MCIAPQPFTERKPPARDDVSAVTSFAVEANGAVPFLDVEIVDADGGGSETFGANDVARLDASSLATTSRDPPKLEEFHALRGLVFGSVANSLAVPLKTQPHASRSQFQLATPENPYHVLAVRCAATSDARDFEIRVSDTGLVYVEKKKGKTDEQFEFVARFPRPVDENSAQSVCKDGVLFVVVDPKES